MINRRVIARRRETPTKQSRKPFIKWKHSGLLLSLRSLAMTVILFALTTPAHACSDPAGEQGQIIYNADQNVPQICVGSKWLALGQLNPGAGGGGCSNPTGDEGDIIYNGDIHVPQYCDGDDWKQMISVVGGIAGSLSVIKYDYNSQNNPAASSCTAPACDAGYSSSGCEIGTDNHSWNDDALRGYAFSDFLTNAADGFDGVCTYTHGDTTTDNANGSVCARLCVLDNDSGSNVGCTAPSLCPNIGDVCDDGNAGTTNDPIFAGFMMYNDPNSADAGRCKPLYVSNNNQATSSDWETPANSSDDIATDSYEDGRINDSEIPNSTTYPAFKECKDLQDGGFDDWYLPAVEELRLLWKNRDAIDTNAAGAFTGPTYWSSTENTGVNNNAWRVYFTATAGGNDDGETARQFKDNSLHVRCVRRD